MTAMIACYLSIFMSDGFDLVFVSSDDEPSGRTPLKPWSCKTLDLIKPKPYKLTYLVSILELRTLRLGQLLLDTYCLTWTNSASIILEPIEALYRGVWFQTQMFI